MVHGFYFDTAFSPSTLISIKAHMREKITRPLILYSLGKLLLSSPGDLTILRGMSINLNSNGTSTQLTLTCISIGGPATFIAWARDHSITETYSITRGTEGVLDDRVTAQYTHTLTVTEASSFNGTHSCKVANKKPSSAVYTVSIKVIHTEYGTSCSCA